MTRWTEIAYKARSPDELAEHNEVRGAGDRVGCSRVMKIHDLIGEDLFGFAVGTIQKNGGG